MTAFMLIFAAADVWCGFESCLFEDEGWWLVMPDEIGANDNRPLVPVA